jgi:hypothetical protein
MQMHDIETQMIDDDSLFSPPKKKTAQTRKWREIEGIKAQQRLTRELQEIDQSFVFSLSDLI